MRTFPWSAAALVAALSMAFGANAQTNVYKWTDSEGKVHFSDTPPEPQVSKNVTEKRMGGGTVDAAQLPYATQMAMKTSPVTLYTASTCGSPCSDGKALLSNRGIPYKERDAQGSREDTEAVKKAIGALQVPVLMVGTEAVKGYDAGSWNAALDAAGYARTKIPGSLAPQPVVASPTSEPGDAAEPPK
jgi:glutaredoxin